jgi:hypothetical protein
MSRAVGISFVYLHKGDQAALPALLAARSATRSSFRGSCQVSIGIGSATGTVAGQSALKRARPSIMVSPVFVGENTE